MSIAAYGKLPKTKCCVVQDAHLLKCVYMCTWLISSTHDLASKNLEVSKFGELPSIHQTTVPPILPAIWYNGRLVAYSTILVVLTLLSDNPPTVFQFFCLSLYSWATRNLPCKGICALEVALNNVLQHIWKLPPHIYLYCYTTGLKSYVAILVMQLCKFYETA